MSNPLEDDLEYDVIAQLQALGWEYTLGENFTPHPESLQRRKLSDVLLLGHLTEAIERLNPDISALVKQEAINKLKGFTGDDLAAINAEFHSLLTDGVTVNTTVDGTERGVIVKVVDFDNPTKNHLLAVNQFEVKESYGVRRPDLVLFVNGIPLVVIELKNPTNENTGVNEAFNQLQTYKREIPSLFHYNGLLVISDGYDARAGSLTAGMSRMSAWKSKDGITRAGTQDMMIDIMVEGMLNPTTLLHTA